MKGTRHNGRSGKDGVYNPLHNDRRFDPEHSEHIDNERVRQNIYWDCYQGYTTMADRGKEDNFSFNQIEMAYYVDHYSDYVINQNKRHEKARHPDRCKGVEDVLKNKKTCPEESIYQLGTIDEHASVETLVLVFDEFKKEFDERFGSNVHIICVTHGVAPADGRSVFSYMVTGRRPRLTGAVPISRHFVVFQRVKAHSIVVKS